MTQGATAIRSKPAYFLVLLIVAAGTLYFTTIGFLDLFEEKRLPGLGWLSMALAWFMVWSWILRIISHPKPTQ